MGILERLAESLQKEKTKAIIRYCFHTIYILSFIFIYIPYYEIESPIKLPDFLYRDIFEYGLISIFVYILYFVKGKKQLINRLPILAGIAIPMIISLFVLAYFKNLRIPSYDFHMAKVVKDLMEYIGFATLLILMFAFIDNIDYFFTNRYKRIQQTLNETHNRLLRQQFHPHFLFNALNSVYSMSLNNNPNTPDTILKLSGMMRYLTDEINIKQIPVDREIKFLREYIAIEKIRFGEDANIKLEIIGSTSTTFIEPLILVPLVENAFKHGFYTNNKLAFVHILIKITSGELILKVKNRIIPSKHNQQNTREGKGLENLKKRLNLSYPNSSKLLFSEENNQFLAELHLHIE